VSFRVTRRSQATWKGTVPEGGGRLALGSGAYEGPFSLKARVEDVEKATNPEELIAAAEAGCFTMSLANLLSEAGHPPEELSTTAGVRLEQVDGRFSITQVELRTTGTVPSWPGRRRRPARSHACSRAPRSHSRRSSPARPRRDPARGTRAMRSNPERACGR
jgi:osmotically inducible protein OsmC